jgi:beta-glucosidase-like glycosyl hydrolase
MSTGSGDAVSKGAFIRTNRTTLDARIDKAALRESDLLSFQLAIERGHPGSVMCGYNLINGDYDCGNSWLLNDVLKRDWRYPGWVMSDWGAVHATDYAVRGLPLPLLSSSLPSRGRSCLPRILR